MQKSKILEEFSLDSTNLSEIMHHFWHLPGQFYGYDKNSTGPKRNNIGFVGYSLGGLTGLWLAGAVARAITVAAIKKYLVVQVDAVQSIIGKTFVGKAFVLQQIKKAEHLVDSVDVKKLQGSYQDKRIKAFLLIAPVFMWLFGDTGLQSVDAPVHIVSLRHDSLTLPEQFIEPYLNDNRYIDISYIEAPQAEHFVFLPVFTQLARFLLPAFLWQNNVGAHRTAIHTQTAKQAILFFKKEFGMNQGVENMEYA